MGNIWGVLGGLHGLVRQFRYLFGARSVDIVVYGLFLAFLFLRPTGILGGVIRQQRI